jgi:hypothetical protein
VQRGRAVPEMPKPSEDVSKRVAEEGRKILV